MNSKTTKLKAGNENSVIIVILAILLVVVIAIVGIYVAKDNRGLATFDGGNVTKAEYEVYYKMFSTYLTYYGYDKSVIPYEILVKAAQDEIILNEAKAAGFTLSDEDKEELEGIFGNETSVKNFQDMGYDIDRLKELYTRDYIMQDYLEQLAVDANDDDVKAYIESRYGEDEEPDLYEYDTSHILFSFSKDDGTTMSDDEKAELKKKAQEVLNRAKNGEDFAELAKEFSDDTTASEGGKFTMYDDGYTVTEYADAVKKLKKGEICSELVETTYGYHIIKLNDKIDGGRVKNSYDRSDYVSNVYLNVHLEKGFKVNEKEFKKAVSQIDPDNYADTSIISCDGNAIEDSTSDTDVDSTEE